MVKMKGSIRLPLYGALLVALFVAFFQPLPENFTDSSMDRFTMYIMELVLRFTYAYPARLCSDAYCELRWTRYCLEKLLAIIGPRSLVDPVVKIENIEFDSIPSRVYVPFNRSNDGAIIFIHGGGFVLGNMNMYESFIRQVAKNSRMVTFSLDYRLAPEHVFPASLDDCERMVLHVLKHAYKDYGINKERIALMGDSAGGGLVASLTYRLRHRKDITQPKLQVLIYPLIQIHNLRTPSYVSHYRDMEGTALVDPQQVVRYYLMYAGVDVSDVEFTQSVLDNKHISPNDRSSIEVYLNLEKIPEEFKRSQNVSLWDHQYDKNASRIMAPFLQNPEYAPIVQPDLSGVPPALIITTEFDILRDEGVVYAERLRQAGIPTERKHFPTGFHAMFNFHHMIKTSGRALQYICDWTVDHI